MSKTRERKEALRKQITFVDDGSLRSKLLKRWSNQLRYASLRKRFFAFLLDFLLSSMVVGIFPMVIMSIQTQEKSFTIANMMKMDLSWQIVCCFVATFMGIYYFCLYPCAKAHLGQTPGKRMMKIKTTKHNEEDIDVKTMLKRELIGSLLLEGETAFPSAFIRYMLFLMLSTSLSYTLSLISIALSVLSIVYLLFGKHHRMFHDYIAQTIVIDL